MCKCICAVTVMLLFAMLCVRLYIWLCLLEWCGVCIHWMHFLFLCILWMYSTDWRTYLCTSCTYRIADRIAIEHPKFVVPQWITYIGMLVFVMYCDWYAADGWCILKDCVFGPPQYIPTWGVSLKLRWDENRCDAMRWDEWKGQA